MKSVNYGILDVTEDQKSQEKIEDMDDTDYWNVVKLIVGSTSDGMLIC